MPTSTSPVLMPTRIWIGGSAPRLGDEAGQRVLHPQGRPHGPLGVVLVGDGRAEQGDDGVAEQLVDASAEQLDVGDQALEARLDQALHALGVEVLGERGVADEVGEQHGDDAPLLERDRSAPTWSAARRAEPRPRSAPDGCTWRTRPSPCLESTGSGPHTSLGVGTMDDDHPGSDARDQGR